MRRVRCSTVTALMVGLLFGLLVDASLALGTDPTTSETATPTATADNSDGKVQLLGQEVDTVTLAVGATVLFVVLLLLLSVTVWCCCRARKRRRASEYRGKGDRADGTIADAAVVATAQQTEPSASSASLMNPHHHPDLTPVIPSRAQSAKTTSTHMALSADAKQPQPAARSQRSLQRDSSTASLHGHHQPATQQHQRTFSSDDSNRQQPTQNPTTVTQRSIASTADSHRSRGSQLSLSATSASHGGSGGTHMPATVKVSAGATFGFVAKPQQPPQPPAQQPVVGHELHVAESSAGGQGVKVTAPNTFSFFPNSGSTNPHAIDTAVDSTPPMPTMPFTPTVMTDSVHAVPAVQQPGLAGGTFQFKPSPASTDSRTVTNQSMRSTGDGSTVVEYNRAFQGNTLGRKDLAHLRSVERDL